MSSIAAQTAEPVRHRQSRIRYSTVNMSKSCFFAFALATICLPVILLSLEADAQPTTDETTSCGSSASDDVVNIVKMIASSQHENAKEIKQLIASNPCGFNGVEPSNQAHVSAQNLVCECLVCFEFHDSF